MFGDKSDLVLVHNMGKGCPYWHSLADGFTRFTKHLENRAGFCGDLQGCARYPAGFPQQPRLNFKMFSSNGTSFNRDMGYENEKCGQMPGMSAFHKMNQAGFPHRHYPVRSRR